MDTDYFLFSYGSSTTVSLTCLLKGVTSYHTMLNTVIKRRMFPSIKEKHSSPNTRWHCSCLPTILTVFSFRRLRMDERVERQPFLSFPFGPPLSCCTNERSARTHSSNSPLRPFTSSWFYRSMLGHSEDREKSIKAYLNERGTEHNGAPREADDDQKGRDEEFGSTPGGQAVTLRLLEDTLMNAKGVVSGRNQVLNLLLTPFPLEFHEYGPPWNIEHPCLCHVVVCGL